MSAARVGAVVLAGGDGRRLGAAVPKPLVTVGDRPMLAHVLDRIPASVSPVLIGANDPLAFAGFERPVVPDRFADRKGPLAGLDAAAAWLRRNAPGATHVLSLPGDTPFLAANLVASLVAEPREHPVMARFEGRPQPAVALWPLAMLDTLAVFLPDADDLSVMGFAARFGGFDTIDVAPSAEAPAGDPFSNVNTPDDLRAAREFFVRKQG